MGKIRESSWLKKYTKLKHLHSTLDEQQLYLGNPEKWPDRNDSELVKLYSQKSGMVDTRATCLTGAPDRFHFWAIFGGYEEGVCLWFDKAGLLRDLKADQTLKARPVQYKTAKQLKTLKLDEIPFTKRKQYADEQEFRVIRDYLLDDTNEGGFKFSASSLKRIYINPWLSRTKFEREKLKVAEMLLNDFEHVTVQQNMTLKLRSWIDAAKAACEDPSNFR